MPKQHNFFFFFVHPKQKCDIKNWNKIEQLKNRPMGNPIGNSVSKAKESLTTRLGQKSFAFFWFVFFFVFVGWEMPTVSCP